jgi:D-alanine-D-alanine ligase
MGGGGLSSLRGQVWRRTNICVSIIHSEGSYPWYINSIRFDLAFTPRKKTMKKFRVALLGNLKKNAPHFEGMPADQWDDLDSENTVNALVEAIRTGGHTCEFLEGDISLFDTVRQFKPDICFNISEGHFGDAREAQVPAILEMLRIPYTGSKVLTLSLALDKPMTKRILHWHELPTPAFQTFERVDEPLNDDL